MESDYTDTTARKNIKVNLSAKDYDRLNIEAALITLPLSSLIRNYAIAYLNLLEEIREAQDGKLVEGSTLHTLLMTMQAAQSISNNRIEQLLHEQRNEIRTVSHILVEFIKLWFTQLRAIPPEYHPASEALFNQFMARIGALVQQNAQSDYSIIPKLIEEEL